MINKSIIPEDYKKLSAEFGISEGLIKTVIAVESAGKGFSPEGNILIQFEPAIFKKYTGILIENKVDVQSKEWSAYNEAKKHDWAKALLSTSWGLGQVMGFNYKVAGYSTIEEMIISFKECEYNQVKGMLNFIKANTKMFTALKSKNWAEFARLYNGSNYKINQYDVRLANAYLKYHK